MVGIEYLLHVWKMDSYVAENGDTVQRLRQPLDKWTMGFIKRRDGNWLGLD